MSDPTNNNALNGINPLAYVGVNPRTPPNFLQRSFPPTQYDSKNVQIGALWLNTGNSIPPVTPPRINDLYVLVALYQGQATWLPFSAGDLQFLTGNTGGPVPPTANNINVVGDGTTVTVAGNPGTSTLTISVVGTGVLSTLTGNSGGAVSPLAGNINVVGDGTTVNIVGNPATHTLTASVVGSGVLSTLTGDTGGAVSPSSGNINILGTANVITTTGTPASHQIVVNAGSYIATSYVTGSGTAVPSANVLNVLGSGSITTLGSGNTVTINSNPGSVNFSAYKSADTANATGDSTVYTIVCDTVVQNTGGGYNSGTGVFTAPKAGLYYFMCIVDMANIGVTHTVGLVEMGILGTPNFYHSFDSNPFNMATSSSMAVSLVYQQIWLLSMGDAIGLQVGVSGVGATKTVTVQGAGVSGNRACYFNGFLIA